MRKDRQPIDFVIAWVDGGDPAWIRQRDIHLLGEAAVAAQECGNIDMHESRYRDWDNLKYWFRGVEKYAPWVRRIHFVTCGQIPDWLEVDNPKLNLVNHSDYMPPEYLPTFSSHPIELNMHKIPGLSEHFVYFNDDFFLTAPVEKEDFFVDGLPCDSVTEDPIQLPGDDFWNSIRLNDTMFASRHFDRMAVKKEFPDKWFPKCSPRDTAKNLMMSTLKKQYFFGIAIHHLPQAYRKSALAEVWELEGKLLHETSTHKFRDRSDVSQYVFKYYQLLTGQFHPCDMRKMGRAFTGTWDPEDAAQTIVSEKCKMICLNDGVDIDFESAKAIVNGAFEQVLGEKSTFEK